MKIYAAGWGRDSGAHRIQHVNVAECDVKYEDKIGFWWNQGAVYSYDDKLSITYGGDISLNGKYKVEVELTQADILALWKAKFGSELSAEILAEAGLTLSDELKKQVIRGITIGELLDSAA